MGNLLVRLEAIQQIKADKCNNNSAARILLVKNRGGRFLGKDNRGLFLSSEKAVAKYVQTLFTDRRKWSPEKLEAKENEWLAELLWAVFS